MLLERAHKLGIYGCSQCDSSFLIGIEKIITNGRSNDLTKVIAGFGIEEFLSRAGGIDRLDLRLLGLGIDERIKKKRQRLRQLLNELVQLSDWLKKTEVRDIDVWNDLEGWWETVQ